MFRCCNPSEAAAENNYLGCFCWRGRRAGRRFWTKKVFADPTSRLRQDSKKEAEQQPTNCAGKRARIPAAVHCGSAPASNGSRTTLIAAQKGNPSAAQVIARSMAEPPSKSKNAKTWAMPSKAPSASPKPTLLRAKQRKGLETIPQSRPIRARRIICFTGPPSKVYHLAFGFPYQCSVLR